MIILGIDPGQVTGMAWWDLDKEAPTQWREEPSETVGEALRLWFSWASVAKAPVRVAVERYTITPGIKTAQPAALMTMGVIEDQCRQHCIPFAYYQPATTKKQVSNTLLRKLGWWTPTKDGHANDALRLCLVQLAHTDPQRYADLVGL